MLSLFLIEIYVQSESVQLILNYPTLQQSTPHHFLTYGDVKVNFHGQAP
jgi:hypothetical protein